MKLSDEIWIWIILDDSKENFTKAQFCSTCIFKAFILFCRRQPDRKFQQLVEYIFHINVNAKYQGTVMQKNASLRFDNETMQCTTMSNV